MQPTIPVFTAILAIAAGLEPMPDPYSRADMVKVWQSAARQLSFAFLVVLIRNQMPKGFWHIVLRDWRGRHGDEPKRIASQRRVCHGDGVSGSECHMVSAGAAWLLLAPQCGFHH
jgi:hypothetical protein